MTGAVWFGLLFAAGAAVTALAGTGVIGGRARGRHDAAPAPGGDAQPEHRAAAAAHSARNSPVLARSGLGPSRRLWIIQGAAAACGAGGGYAATRLWGMAVLAGGLGLLLPPFVAAPAQRRRHTAEAVAWQTWTRQIAELARSGAGLGDALAASTSHAPPQIADTVARTARTARLAGLGAATGELAAAGQTWEPEVAAGLRVAATSGGSLAGPLGELAGRIGDIVALHRTRTEAVVQLWTQTIALLALASGVITLMYRNNPAYFEPYRTPTGQAVLMLIAFVLLGATAFLVRHSVVRADPSVLVDPRRRGRARDPL
ncbi:type II secretion system F family protein [Candidatus Poriferisodalis sp.]|uniref:type II secretion system F family protein n=1 Tax=Candidatus Poriferisodalis sp. TaxID=3101277 RepID=UPI003B02CBFA